LGQEQDLGTTFNAKSRGLGQTEMAMTQGKKPFVFGMVVLATLVAASAAHAVCKSPKNICKHFDLTSKDADEIRAGLKARNGRVLLAGAEACARELGRKKEWDEWARGCSDIDYVAIARAETELGRVFCDRYSQ
jgi:hypothetical protein